MELEEEEQEMELATMQEDGDAIMIPVRDSEELVRVNLDELPKDAEEIIEILKAEFAPLDIWLKFAVCTRAREVTVLICFTVRVLQEGVGRKFQNHP